MAEFRLRRSFTGGVRLVANKRVSTGLPIARDLSPESLIIPMRQQSGPAARPTVGPGDRVVRGQVIGDPVERGAVGVHASRAGDVVCVEERLVPSGNGLIRSECVTIRVGENDPVATNRLTWPDSPKSQIEMIRAAGIVGLGGAAFPTAGKLEMGEATETLILNGAECEPYISCDDMLMREHAPGIVAGARIMMGLLGATVCLFAIERDKPLALKSVAEAIADSGDERFHVKRVPTVYPAGGERQLVELLLRKEIPGGKYPVDLGCVCLNVGTAYALNRLARAGEPLITRIVTVTGEGMRQAKNVEVPIGTPVREVIRYCGGYAGDVERLILGGSMMGYAVSTDDLPVTKATNCIIAASADEVRGRYDEWPCIRCGDCAAACPSRLMPQELLRSSRMNDFGQLDALGLTDCIECGCCDVVCPSQIPLTAYFRDAKGAQRRHERNKRLADDAEERFSRREKRERERDQQRERQLDELKSRIARDPRTRRQTIQAAIERAQRKHDTDYEVHE